MSLDDFYRRVIMDHYKNPPQPGEIEDGAVTIDLNNPTLRRQNSPCSCEMEDGKIQEAKFLGEGCSISQASASMMTEAIKGKTVEEALRMAGPFPA